MTAPLFFYGSLRDDLILSAVLGRPAREVDCEEAWLEGYVAERAQNYSFPVLVPAAGQQVAGRIAHSLTMEDLRRIAYFEDSEYEIKHCVVRCALGEVLAKVYLGSDKLASSGEPWNLAEFQARDRALLLAVTQHVMSEHYGVTPQAVMEREWAGLRDSIAMKLKA